MRDGRLKLTNLPWILDVRELAKSLSIEHIFLINDLVVMPTEEAMLRRLHPEWFIGWVIDYRWKPLLEAEGCCTTPGRSAERPLVDRIHEIPTQAWKHKAFTRETAAGIVRLRRELRAEHYELCIDMQGLIRSALVGSVSGSRRLWSRAGPRSVPCSTEPTTACW